MSARTPVAGLFVYHIFGLPRELSAWGRDPSAYALEVKGLVETPSRLTLERLRSGFPAVVLDTVLQCMTNIHRGRVEVRGVRLLDVLEAAGLRPEARKVGLLGAEGFTTDLFLADLRREPDLFLLAYEMNGEPLTPEHGFPVRVVADGKYAYKWCKWLISIEAVDYDIKGHYEGVRGWSDAATRGVRVI